MDASDVNTPINTIANEFNGNIDNANIKASAAIDASKLASASITNSQMDVANSLVTRMNNGFFDYVESGCVWSGDSYGSTLNASMTAGVVVVDGIRAVISAVTARAFTASRDTYIDITSAGVVEYAVSTTNAASQALASGRVRVGIIVSGVASIANVAAVNQGQENKVLPIASSIPYAVTDSLGNLICNRSPNATVIGYRQIITTFSTASASAVQVTGLTCPVIVPTGRKVKVTFSGEGWANTATNNTIPSIWDGVVASGTQLMQTRSNSYTGGAIIFQQPSAIVTPTSATKTYNAGVAAGGSGTVTMVGSTTAPAYIMVELV